MRCGPSSTSATPSCSWRANACAPTPSGSSAGSARPLRDLFERGQADGDIRRDIASARLTESLIGLIVGVRMSTPPLGKEDQIATITGLFLDGARARGPRR